MFAEVPTDKLPDNIDASPNASIVNRSLLDPVEVLISPTLNNFASLAEPEPLAVTLSNIY